jgi:perosamine synthetase
MDAAIGQRDENGCVANMDSFPISKPSLTALERQYVTRAIESGWVSSIGEYIDRFESGFAAFCETRNAIAVSNGTTALHLALTALGIGPGDEVIVPDLSFIATANSVLMCGATPVFADIDPITLCLAPAEIERLCTDRTRAVMPVHLYGHPADMSAILELAEQRGLLVIEDAAEAHGASLGGRKVGGFGTCATFSFYGNKNLTTGEGGMITTNDDALAARCRRLRDHAMSPTRRYWHEELGYNYRLTNIQAALGCAQVERAQELLDSRNRVFGWYAEELRGANGILLNRAVDGAKPCYWMICAEFEGLDEMQRARIMAQLKERGVDSRPYFYPMSDMPYFERADTPVAHEVSQRGLNLPTYVDLTRDDVATISQAVREIWQAL